MTLGRLWLLSLSLSPTNPPLFFLIVQSMQEQPDNIHSNALSLSILLENKIHGKDDQ